MKILITGGFGFIGGNLIDRLSQTNEILVSSRRSQIPESFKHYRNIKLFNHNNLLNSDSFPSDVDVLIHLANLNAKDCLLYPSQAINVNIEHSRLIFQNALKHKTSHIIYFSTSQVYGSALEGIINERTPTNPDNLYSITHKSAEDVLKFICNDSSSIIYSIIRLSNSYGVPIDSTADIWDTFINNLCKSGVKTKKLTIKSNPNILKDFIPMSNVIDSISFLINNSKSSRTYNLTSGNTITLLDMAKKIKTIYDSEFNPSQLDISIINQDITLYTKFNFLNENFEKLGYKNRDRSFDDIKNLLHYCSNTF